MSNSIKNHHVKTRFCPSPTGLIHLGNARTALFSALFAKKMSGSFLLRIEDTDRERSKQEYADIMMQDLKWLGVDWQEGPDHDKGAGPYYQSERQFIYDDYYERLEVAGEAYPCFCSEDELALARKIQRASGKPPRYPGTCRNLSPEDIQQKRDSGLKPTLRFAVPTEGALEYDDFVRGKQRFVYSDIGDFIVRRANGTPPFMFCNAIDDALMKVTHVMRGEDHITNTPRQLMILNAVSLDAPQYGHISLILGQDGSPLSKRNGSRSIEALRSEGYLFEAVINYMARLGHYYGHDDLLSMNELAEQFTIEGLSKSPAKFNPQQLNYWQKEAMSNIEAHVLWDWLQSDEQQLVTEARREAFLTFIKPNVQRPQELKKWVHAVFGKLPEFTPEYKAILHEAGADFFQAAIKSADAHGTNFKQLAKQVGTETGTKGKKLYQPLRLALTGEIHGPELAEMLVFMNPADIKGRFEHASTL
ncbi:MAG: glutamate--tRNA ligase [Coxiella sp. (in: Bacteria)]|nr:MAG: glutamate--tRNA ligase [Coxiella sp. (in: g-proteobacteria)]